MMKTIMLNTFSGDWNTVAAELEHGGEPIALMINETVHGIVLPTSDALRVVERYADRVAAQAQQTTAARNDDGAPGSHLLTYLELLRDDPALVPHVDGQPLEFVTMMNSSFVDPEQLYEFRHPRTNEAIMYRARELRRAIGRQFANVEFVPARPRDVVEGKLKLR